VLIKNRQQLLLILAGVVFGLLIADKLVFTPLVESWKARTVRIADLRKKVDDGEKLVLRADALRSRWEDMRGGALTNNNSFAEQKVLQSFDRWSQDARISVNSISPQWKRNRDETFQTLECRVDASGSIGALARFLFNLEQDPIALRVDAIEISARDQGQNLSLALQVSGLMLDAPEGRR
jgi:hypothetical protein